MEEDRQKIQDFVQIHPYNTIFQSPAYYSFYLDLPQFTPLYLISYDENHLVDGIMLAVSITEGGGLLAHLSRRCVVYGGPLIRNDDTLLLSALLKTLNEQVNHSVLFTQFRNFRQWESNQITVFEQNGYVFRERLNLLVTLTGTNEVQAAFSATRRRQLKKALQNGAVIQKANNLEEVQKLYALLSHLYKNKVRKPLPPLTFFKRFYSLLMAKGDGIILLVKKENQIIGGIVAPVTSSTTISELYVCGLDQEYPTLYPSIVATWAAMEYGVTNGITQFDFMGLGRPDVPYGVREFKLRFGGKQVNYGRFARRNNKIVYYLAEMGYNILRSIKKI